MFACIVAGRAVQTNLAAVSPTKYVLTIDDPASVNHIVVFLTGQAPIEPGLVAAIFIAWPPDYSTWNYVGQISNEKPSSVFRLRHGDVPMGDGNAPAQLGVSLEMPAALPTPASGTSRVLSYETVSRMPDKIVTHFFDFAMSFSTRNPVPTAADDQWIPARCMHQWYDSIKNRMSKDSDFWTSG